MKNKLLIGALLIAMLCPLIGVGYAQRPPLMACLKVFVHNGGSEHSGITGARVNITMKSCPSYYRGATTDGGGNVSFNGIPPTTYYVRAFKWCLGGIRKMSKVVEKTLGPGQNSMELPICDCE